MDGILGGHEGESWVGGIDLARDGNDIDGVLLYEYLTLTQQYSLGRPARSI